jgi:RNA polymerase sigma-70 factor (ECF subfamily)
MTRVSELTTGHPDREVVEALCRGDEIQFRALVHRHHRAMVSVAANYVPSRAIAEEVVQDTWIAVVKQLDRFEGRSSLKTWIFAILVNQARNRGAREQRSVPMSSLVDLGPDEPAVDPGRFNGADHPQWPGHWSQPPRPLDSYPADVLGRAETTRAIEAAIAALPVNQQRVVWLRDVEGWSSIEVCEALGISEANQRVLLHRGRSKVRAALETILEGSLS